MDEQAVGKWSRAQGARGLMRGSIIREGGISLRNQAETTIRFVHLDMLRGVAALAVVVGHARGFALVDFSEVTDPNNITQGVYFLSGLGHQAVIAFFALSGFLVGGSIISSMRHGRWSFQTYVISRLSRLYTVVVPALLLTLGLDSLGAAIAGPDGYAGVYYHLLSSGPVPSAPANHTVFVFLANLTFQQTTLAPVFGSNGPLWSLSYEFWYYVMGPLAAASVLVRGRASLRFTQALAALTCAIFLPTHIVFLSIVWAAGALSHSALSCAMLARCMSSSLYFIAAIAVLLVLLVLSRGRPGVHWEIFTGLAWAGLLPALALRRTTDGRFYAQLAYNLSEISYTLYAIHFPLLAFIWFVFLAPRQLQPDYEGILLVAGLVLLSVAGATALWWCFERHTSKVRAYALWGLNSILNRNRQREIGRSVD